MKIPPRKVNMKQELKALWLITKYLTKTIAYAWLFVTILNWYWEL